MTNRTRLRSGIKALPGGILLALLFSLGSMVAIATPMPQEQEEDGTRRLWNKQFEAARAKAKNAKPVAKTPPVKPKQQTAAADGALIGVTVWRLRAPEPSGAQSGARLLVKKVGGAPSQHQLERAAAETPFSEGQRLRISVETPREGTSYLYVIDREVYTDGTLGEPSLIFPARSTPPGSNVAEAGKIISIPAQGDPLPYFTLQRSSPNHVSERLTLIISPEPLPLEARQENLDPVQLARWEKEWGGLAERRDAHGSVGRLWTVAEQAAEQGERKLLQGDPLPQTIYRVKANPGGQVVVSLLLRIAQ